VLSSCCQGWFVERFVLPTSVTEICLEPIVICMQTTLRMDDGLLRRAKAVAAEEGESLTAFIEGALRQRLQARERAATATRPEIPVAAGSGGLLPGVDLDDSAALADLMEDR